MHGPTGVEDRTKGPLRVVGWLTVGRSPKRKGAAPLPLLLVGCISSGSARLPGLVFVVCRRFGRFLLHPHTRRTQLRTTSTPLVRPRPFPRRRALVHCVQLTARRFFSVFCGSGLPRCWLQAVVARAKTTDAYLSACN